MTVPPTFSAATALSTVFSGGLLLKLTVVSVPPAKSMPSRKCLVVIEMMPGMMMISESRKNQFLRPTMSSLRTRGGSGSLTGGAGAATASSTASTSSSAVSSAYSPEYSLPSSASAGSSSLTGLCCLSDGSSTVHSEQRRPAHAARRQHDGQQVVGHEDRREQAGDHADREHDGESLDRGRPDEQQDAAGDQRRRVRVADRGPRAAHRGIDRGGYGAPRAHLFLESFEDQHVRVDGHTDGQDEAGDAGQRQGHRDRLEQREHLTRIEEEGEAREESGQAVVDDHEQHHDRQAEKARGDAELHRLGAEGGTDLRDVEHHEVHRQGAGVDAGREVVRLGLGEARGTAADLRLAAGDLAVGDGVDEHLAAVVVALKQRRLDAGVVPLVDVLLRQVEPDGEEAL